MISLPESAVFSNMAMFIFFFVNGKRPIKLCYFCPFIGKYR